MQIDIIIHMRRINVRLFIRVLSMCKLSDVRISEIHRKRNCITWLDNKGKQAVFMSTTAMIDILAAMLLSLHGAF